MMRTRSQKILALLNPSKDETVKGVSEDLRRQAVNRYEDCHSHLMDSESKSSSAINETSSQCSPFASSTVTEEQNNSNYFCMEVTSTSDPPDTNKGTVIHTEKKEIEPTFHVNAPPGSHIFKPESSDDESKTSGSEYLASDDDHFDSSDSEQEVKNMTKKKNKNKISKPPEKFEAVNTRTINTTTNKTNKKKILKMPRQVTSTKFNESPHSTTSTFDTAITSNDFCHIGTHNVVVPTAVRNAGKLVRNKAQACYFCQSVVQNAARHFELLHGKEPEVAKLLAKPKHSKERRDGFANLIRVGNFYHNTEVLSSGRGDLILVRRPTENEVISLNPGDFGPCPHCLGFMMKKHLWFHIKNNCKAKCEKDETSSRHVIGESDALLNDAFGRDISRDFVSHVLCKVKDDETGLYCKEDLLIQRYGAMMFEKYGTTQCELIRQNMRQLARLTLKLREMGKTKNGLSDFLQPQMFDSIIHATKLLCETHQNIALRPEFKTPSLALKIGYALRKCAGIKRGSCLRAGNLSGNEALLGFLNLMELEWSTRISSNALTTLYNRKVNATQLLPLTSDLIKLSQYLNIEMVKVCTSLSQDPSINEWSLLASLTLSKIILFNKRRSGEAARMKLFEYSSRPQWSDQSTEELKKSLTDFEKKLADQLTLVEVIGKRGKKVPVLLTQDMKASLDKLNEVRHTLDISKENPFIFARTGASTANMRGHECLRRACVDAGLENPENITSTKLRKYTATVCQIFNLSENDYDWLARHLGHDIRVHREFYRLHESAVELTKVSRLLIAVEKGQVNKFAGKSLDEINLEDIPNEVEESENEEDEREITNENEETFEEQLRKKRKQSLESIPDLPRQVAPREAQPKCKNKSNTVKRPWTSDERAAVLRFFKNCIKAGIVPGKEDCSRCINQNLEVLSTRSWTNVKYFVKNHLDKIKKIKGKQ